MEYPNNLFWVLFLIFINDLPLARSRDTNSTDMYAGDTTIHSIHWCMQTVKTNLKFCLDNLEIWCKSNGMIMNREKTNVLLITTPQKRARHAV